LKKAMDVRSAVGSKAIAARWEAKKLPTSTSSIPSVGDGSNNQSSSFLAPGSVPAPAPAPSSPPSNLAPSDSHAPSLSYTFDSPAHQIVPTSFSPAPPPPPPTQWFSGVTFSVDPDGSATTNQKTISLYFSCLSFGGEIEDVWILRNQRRHNGFAEALVACVGPQRGANRDEFIRLSQEIEDAR
jgi:hypothetical protein